MPSIRSLCGLAVVISSTARALDGIVAPPVVQAGLSFNVTFRDGNKHQYRIFLAATTTGVQGPTCYLLNSTEVTSPATLTVPPVVGPPASHYSIAMADLTTGQGATYSNNFALTNATGVPTEYEKQLQGAPFYDANHLPCEAYGCARKCANELYSKGQDQPKEFASDMKACMLDCGGVTESGKAMNDPSEPESSATSDGSGDGADATSTSSEATSNSSDATSTSSDVATRETNAAAAAVVGVIAFLL